MARPSTVLVLVMALAALALLAEARYLPTRSQDDRLERLRELIRDLLENEVNKYTPNNNAPAELFGEQPPFLFQPRQVPGRMVIADEDRK